jgi:hypothetical protein
MNIKQKFANAKKKIQESPIAKDAAVIACCLATTAYTLYVITRVDAVRKDIAEAREDLEMADAVIRGINDGAKHVRETGHSITYFNRKGEPAFVMSAPEED